jgi:three-Cys-motif partner protein
MGNAGFHDEPYDAGTLTKLKIFELYVQAWIPVFVSRPEPPFPEIHLFDLFSGPGTDAVGVPGSPLRILSQLKRYQLQGLPGWSRVKIGVHFSDSHAGKTERLAGIVATPEWRIVGITPVVRQMRFRDALELHRPVLENPRAAKLLILDQFGVDEIDEEVFRDLVRLPRTDFIFFLSSSTLHRFRNHPAISIKIDRPENSYDVHRAAFTHFRKLAGSDAFLGRFSIRKRSNIYGLIFGSQHPLGVHKFLEVAWSNDEIAGEANFDIDREGVASGEMLLSLAELRPKKIQEFEADLEHAIRAGEMRTEADLVRFAIEAGMTCQHCTPVIKKLKAEDLIACDFRTPNVRNYYSPRDFRFL